MTKRDKEITLDSNIAEVIEQYPNSVEVFLENGLPCVGCAAARFESISDVVSEFGVDGKKLIEDIKKSANTAEEEE